MSLTIFAVILAIIAVLLGVLLTRAIFKIPTFLRLQEAQVSLLIAIAEKQGVGPEGINFILKFHGLEGSAVVTRPVKKEVEPAPLVESGPIGGK